MWGDKTSLKSHFHSHVSSFWLTLGLIFVWFLFLIPLWTDCITVDRQTMTFW